jgi:hypothetical protein
MVTLEKNNQEAIAFVSEFIENQWQDDSNKYIGIGFDDGAFNKTTLKGYCLAEQENVCCYCSREIDKSSNTQLEHIIPRAKKTNQDTLERYFVYSPILSENIVLQSIFADSTERQSTPPFPHHIAYHNIVATCNGKTIETTEDTTCCNRNRGDDFVPPFNLMASSIAYLKDGTIYYINDEINYRNINPLNLNKDLLKNIRRIWFLFANTDVTENELLNANNQEKILEVITLYLEVSTFKSPSDRNVIDSFKTLSNWGTLMKYLYFLNYFRTNNI